MKVFLFAPSTVLGGTETLALRLGREFVDRKLDTAIVTESPGWLAEKSRQAGLTVVSPSDFCAMKLPAAAKVLASSKYLLDPHLTPHLQQTTYWILHPLEFCWSEFKQIFGAYRHFSSETCGRAFRLLRPRAFKRLQAEYRSLAKTNRLLSMSADCTDFTNRFLDANIDLPLVTLPSELNADELAVAKLFPKIEAIAYFGRIEDFKVPSIKRLLLDVATLPETESLGAVQLFGFGRAEAEIHQYATKIGISIEITGALPIAEVALRAKRSNALVFTMGLSGLDLIAQGVPSVFLPIPTSSRDYRGKYAFLHQLPLGCVGAYPEFLEAANGYSLPQLLTLVKSPRAIDSYRQDFIRIKTHHNLSATTNALLSRMSG